MKEIISETRLSEVVSKKGTAYEILLLKIIDNKEIKNYHH